MQPGNTPAAAAAGAQSRAERLNTRAAGVVALAVLCSRVLGLAREQIFSALFGGGRVLGAFTLPLPPSQPLPHPFGGSAPSPAVVPLFTPTPAPGGGPAARRPAHQR